MTKKTSQELEQGRIYAREKYRERVAARLCGLCGSPLPVGQGKTCDACLSKVKHWGQRTRAQRRLQGKCPHCGEPRMPGRKLCSLCLAEAADRYRRRKEAGLCCKCGAPAQEGKANCSACKTALRAYSRDRRDRLIAETMLAYGGCRCVCCGETEFAFLTLDHIHGGGTQHRKRLRKDKEGGGDVYAALKKAGYPPGYQVLCMNCNWAKGKYGECPHVRQRCAASLDAVG